MKQYRISIEAPHSACLRHRDSKSPTECILDVLKEEEANLKHITTITIEKPKQC